MLKYQFQVMEAEEMNIMAPIMKGEILKILFIA